MLNGLSPKISIILIVFVSCASRIRLHVLRNIYQWEQPLINREFVRLNDDRSESSYDAVYVILRAYTHTDNTSMHTSRSSSNERVDLESRYCPYKWAEVNTTGRYETRDINDINYYLRPTSPIQEIPFREAQDGIFLHVLHKT